VNDYFPKAVRGTSLQRHATASPLYDYTEQGPSTTSMSSPRDNGAPVDSVNHPTFGYKLNLFCVFLFEFYLRLNLNTSICFALTGSLIFVMNVLIISGIKMYRKFPSFLTFVSLRTTNYFSPPSTRRTNQISLFRKYFAAHGEKKHGTVLFFAAHDKLFFYLLVFSPRSQIHCSSKKFS
jgi:hypothetical protein